MKLTAHARDRMEQMALTRDDVYGVLRGPEVCYTSDRGLRPGQPLRLIHVRGRIAVVTAGKFIVTVLWHSDDYEAWDRQEERLA